MSTVEYLTDPGSQALYMRHVDSEQSNQPSHIGLVLGHHVTGKKQSVDVALLQFFTAEGQPLIMLKLPITQEYGGAGWGIHRGLGKGVLVEVLLDNGSTRNARVGKVIPWNRCPPIGHPMVVENNGDKYAYVVQAPVDAPTTPGALWGVFADGTAATIAPARELKTVNGTSAVRHAGPAIQAAEMKLAQGKAKGVQAQAKLRAAVTKGNQLTLAYKQSAAIQAKIARVAQTQGGIA